MQDITPYFTFFNYKTFGLFSVLNKKIKKTILMWPQAFGPHGIRDFFFFLSHSRAT